MQWLLLPGLFSFSKHLQFTFPFQSLVLMSSCYGSFVTVQVIRQEWRQQAFPDWSPELSHLRQSLAPSPVLENSPWHPSGWFLPQICPFKWLRRGAQEQEILMSSCPFLFWGKLENDWINGPTPRRLKWKTKKPLLARVRELHDKSMNRCRILHTKQMTASPCKASRMKLLANEREQVWMSMSAPIKKRTKKKNL